SLLLPRPRVPAQNNRRQFSVRDKQTRSLLQSQPRSLSLQQSLPADVQRQLTEPSIFLLRRLASLRRYDRPNRTGICRKTRRRGCDTRRSRLRLRARQSQPASSSYAIVTRPDLKMGQLGLRAEEMSPTTNNKRQHETSFIHVTGHSTASR